jgi:hypothetical protein
MSAADDHLALLARWTRNLDPQRALDLSRADGEDLEWYVDLDAWSYDGNLHGLRGRPAVARIVDSIRLAAANFESQSTHLFSGFRGTGKTTELSRLARELELHGYTVLRMSARSYHPLSEALSIEEFAVMLAAGIGEAVAEKLGEKQLDDAAREKVWARIRGTIVGVFKAAQLSFKLGPMELRAALSQGESAAQSLSKLIGGRHDLLQSFLHEFVRDVVASVHPRQIVILVDDLEKFDVPIDRVGPVYRQMANLFFNRSDILKLPNCHVVYTVPPYLTFIHAGVGGKYEQRLYVLPSIKLRGRRPEHEVFPPGLAALRQLLGERVDLQRLFGDEGDAAVNRLISTSGGNLRDLFSLTRDTIQAALRRGLPVGMAEVEEAIQHHAALRPLLKESFELLRDIEAQGDLTAIDADRQNGFAQAMDQHLVLCYWNGEFWYDTHPMIEPQLERHTQRSEGG